MTIMGLFGLFKSKEEKFRSHDRACFDESVKNEIKEKGYAVKDPLFGGMMVQAAIGSVCQKIDQDHKLHLFALKSDINPQKIVEEECNRALSKYLE